jgi:hypothetical protein
MIDWKVNFRETLEFGTVKKRIEHVKTIKKDSCNESGYMHGEAVESSLVNMLSYDSRLSIKRLSPQMDIGFGADMQVSYVKDNKNYSFFSDITSTQKKNLFYFDIKGNFIKDINKAFVYETEAFNVRFAIKNKHSSIFTYEKPVIVLYIENFKKDTELDQSHINNIGSVLISLNEMLYSKGYGARASQNVKPNKALFQTEYMQYVDENNLWPEYMGELVYKHLRGGMAWK